jgi:phenylalanine-4-hydroxylase
MMTGTGATGGARPAPGSGLTTTKAPFIEQARASRLVFIHQPYELYSPENHATWGRLLERMKAGWQRHASAPFLAGVERLRFSERCIPRLEEVNGFLLALTGFRAHPVSGYLPSYLFFDCLRRREFPTAVTIRDAATLDYLPEPDIFHDVAGHVPMHTDAAFARALVRLGDCAAAAARRAAAVASEGERFRRLTSNIRALSRFFWFSVEFGLVSEVGGLRAYGSGLLSSPGELAHAIASPAVQRFPFQLEWVVNQTFEIDRYQPILFAIESFEHLYQMVRELEEWLLFGRLDNVAAGEPAVREDDLRSFLSPLPAPDDQGEGP